MTTPDLTLRFHPLTFLDEGDAVTVGRTDVDSYCVLPADGAFLLRRMTEGTPPDRAAQEYAARFGETVDVDDFVASMAELGFLQTTSDTPDTLDTLDTPADPRALRGRRLGQALFSRPAGLLYLALLTVTVVQSARHPDLVPHYHDLFFTGYLTVVMLVLFVGQIPFLLLHEGFHMLAGRRLGLRSTLGISRRLWFTVAETTMNGLVTVPRRQRYLPILSGMLADLLAVAALILVASVLRHPDGSQPLAGRLCLAFAFYNALRIVWQFYFYLRTDLYYLAVTVFGCIDLHDSAMLLMRNRFHRLLRRPDQIGDENTIHPRDRGVARWYSWLVLAGYGFSASVLLLTGIPMAVYTLGTVAGHLISPDVTPAERTDAITFVAVNALQFALLAYVYVRDRRASSTEPVRSSA